MTGLMVKDFLVMRKSIKTYILFLAFYFVMAALGIFPISFNSSVIISKLLFSISEGSTCSISESIPNFLSLYSLRNPTHNTFYTICLFCKFCHDTPVKFPIFSFKIINGHKAISDFVTN